MSCCVVKLAYGVPDATCPPEFCCLQNFGAQDLAICCFLKPPGADPTCPPPAPPPPTIPVRWCEASGPCMELLCLALHGAPLRMHHTEDPSSSAPLMSPASLPRKTNKKTPLPPSGSYDFNRTLAAMQNVSVHASVAMTLGELAGNAPLVYSAAQFGIQQEIDLISGFNTSVAVPALGVPPPAPPPGSSSPYVLVACYDQDKTLAALAAIQSNATAYLNSALQAGNATQVGGAAGAALPGPRCRVDCGGSAAGAALLAPRPA